MQQTGLSGLLTDLHTGINWFTTKPQTGLSGLLTDLHSGLDVVLTDLHTGLIC